MIGKLGQQWKGGDSRAIVFDRTSRPMDFGGIARTRITVAGKAETCWNGRADGLIRGVLRPHSIL